MSVGSGGATDGFGGGTVALAAAGTPSGLLAPGGRCGACFGPSFRIDPLALAVAIGAVATTVACGVNVGAGTGGVVAFVVSVDAATITEEEALAAPFTGSS